MRIWPADAANPRQEAFIGIASIGDVVKAIISEPSSVIEQLQTYI